MLLADQRSAVVAACRDLLAAGLVRGTSGNVSVREQATGTIAITPTGVPYPGMRASDVAALAPDGSQLAGALKPTSELALHLAVYRDRPDVGAVVHTHSVFATTFAVLGEQIPPVHYLIVRAGGAVPVAPYARYGTAELAESCVRTLGRGFAVLLANHGVVAVGADLAAAMAVAEAVEYTAELAWRARQAGVPQLLDADQLAAVAEAFAGYGQPSGRDESK
ncbi:class II aldolase/adducin family protein [Jatrophihabitans sp.]|uniref:class II aldolase/adducin family protein n=1 Tax=Jatrophihabitans sp. TaxID=1932789 RepID=UPI002C647946|nr:class II aldolase/adducin family protein [Jatrophihabitans sp.]